MWLISKIKETVLCLRAGRVTLSYPVNPRPVPARFRGRPVFDPHKCIGCAGCANNCPAREILIDDPCQEMRIVRYVGRRCTYCGRCAELCPEKAITMSKEYENASKTRTTYARTWKYGWERASAAADASKALRFWTN